MKEEKLWSPLVYSRTYQADFRFLVMPEDLAESSQKKKALKIITDIVSKLSTSSSKEENDRWLFIKDNNHCIIGIISRADSLVTPEKKSYFIKTFLANEPSSSQKITKDINGRDFYLFAGYITQLSPNGELPFIPFIESFRVSFEILYLYVCKVWLEYQHTIHTNIQNYDYNIPSMQIFPNHPPSMNEYSNAISSRTTLNKDSNVIKLWPDTNEYRKQLWGLFLKQYGNMAICLGLDEITAKESTLLNATVIGNKEIKSIVRKQEEAALPQTINSNLLNGRKTNLSTQDSNVGAKTQITAQVLSGSNTVDFANEHFNLKDSPTTKEEETITAQALDSKNANLNITINNSQPSVLIPGILFSGIDPKEDLSISIYIQIKRSTKTDK